MDKKYKDVIHSVKENANVLVVSPDFTARNLLLNAGFRHVETIKNDIYKLELELKEDKCDLLLMDDIFDNVPTTKLIQSIRAGDVGHNPFLPIISMITSNNNEMVYRKIDAGVDDVVIKPLSPLFIQKRIINMIKRDFQYVVTHDYIGPNRRSKDRTDKNRDHIIDIPNTLVEKSIPHNNKLQLKIQMAQHNINNRKVQSQGNKISVMIQNAIDSKKQLKKELQEIKKFLDDFSNNLQKYEYNHIIKLCDVLAFLIDKTNDCTQIKNIELLQLVSEALDIAFDHDYKEEATQIIRLIDAKFNMMNY